MRKLIFYYGAIGALAMATSLRLSAQQSMADDQVPATYTQNVKGHTLRSDSAAGGGVIGRRANGSVLGVDSLPNWSSYFYLPGLVDDGGSGFPQWTWQYTMVGRSPFSGADHGDGDNHEGGATTTIAAPIVPVNIVLLDTNGSVRIIGGKPAIMDATQYVNPVLKSPVFDRAVFDSSDGPTQYADGVQRAEFFRAADPDWHTMLQPATKTARTMTLRRGTYRFAANPDGTCCAYVLVNINVFTSQLFPASEGDPSTVIGVSQKAGDIRTTDLSTFLFPNTFLYFPDSAGNPADCCVLGFHSYDVEPGSAANGWREKRYVMNYSSWISPGLFNTFTDVTALSHEISEAFNDPFVNNATPIWLSPNGLCQANLEDGDVIEGLPNALYPMTLNGFTYHPQNVALLQWFAAVTPSNAIHRAYSYPDTTVLTSASVPMTPGCKGPANVPGGK